MVQMQKPKCTDLIEIDPKGVFVFSTGERTMRSTWCFNFPINPIRTLFLCSGSFFVRGRPLQKETPNLYCIIHKHEYQLLYVMGHFTLMQTKCFSHVARSKHYDQWHKSCKRPLRPPIFHLLFAVYYKPSVNRKHSISSRGAVGNPSPKSPQNS